MLYQSTRNNKLRIRSYEAILKGISDDGGLFVPTETPLLENVDNLIGSSYCDCAKFVLSKFLPDFSAKELSACIRGAYGDLKFESESVAPVRLLDRQQSVLELWHGPTCAFKDMALQILPRLLVKCMEKSQCDQKILILVATSGDTGKAALEGFKDVKNTKILVFYPSDGVSKMQKLQMITQEGSNVRVCGIDGNFDDAQSGVKRIFNSPDMKKALDDSGYSFSSANSINWGRLVPQIVYYVYSYLQLVDNGTIRPGGGFNVCVPTGNFGNILAAYYAKKMGIPIKKLICASNRNDVLTEFLNTGVYNKRREFYNTISPSMDILVSSNLERLIFDLSGYDDEYVQSLYKSLSNRGYFEVHGSILDRLRSLFACGSSTDDETRQTIRNTFVEFGYLMDPHTSVAENVYRKYRNDTGDITHTLIVSTASPYKFPASVLSALDGGIGSGDEFELIRELSAETDTDIPARLWSLRNKPVRFERVVKKTDMDAEVLACLR